MDELLSILNDIDPTVNWNSEEDFIGRGVIDSIGIVSLVIEIEDCFGIFIRGIDITPMNFYSVKTIHDLIRKSTQNE